MDVRYISTDSQNMAPSSLTELHPVRPTSESKSVKTHKSFKTPLQMKGDPSLQGEDVVITFLTRPPADIQKLRPCDPGGLHRDQGGGK